jgi:hypothetical protein
MSRHEVLCWARCLPAIRLTERGLTFVETALASFLAAMIAGGLMTSYLMWQKAFQAAETMALVQQQARQAFNIMVAELREAGNLSVTDNPNLSKQLNFQIVLGYNNAGGRTTCPNTICWGNEVNDVGGWIHYAIVGPQGNLRQLIRCTDTTAAPQITTFTQPACRVLANHVRHPNNSDSDLFVIEADGRVRINLEIEYRINLEYHDPQIPTGGQTTRVLTTRVMPRN